MKFPIFPLNGAILFPGTNLPLNIFEKRYIEMVDYALSNNRLIGMIQKKENNDFFDIGCLGKITSFSETGDGRYQINLEGLNRFLLKKVVKSENSFIIIDAEVLKSNKEIKEKNDLNEKFLFNFKKFLKIKNINFNYSEFENLDASSLAKIICIISPLDHLIKQMLLEFDSDYELCKNLLSVLEIEMKNNENNLKIN